MQGSAGSSVLGGIFDIIGRLAQNDENRRTMRRQENFQERMSSTAFQRAMQDMRKGGLNPILAAGGNSASSPGGATYRAESPTGGAAQSALAIANIARVKSEIENIKANTAKTNADKYNVYQNMGIKLPTKTIM